MKQALENTRTLSIEGNVYAMLEAAAKEKGFKDANEYANRLLEQAKEQAETIGHHQSLACPYCSKPIAIILGSATLLTHEQFLQRIKKYVAEMKREDRAERRKRTWKQ